MARAPKPGSTEQDDVVIKITLQGETLELNLRDWGPQDDLVFEQQTGFTLPDALAQLGVSHKLAAVVWAARRKRGERKLVYQQLLKRFPGMVELGELFDSGDFDIDVTGVDDDGDGREVAADPLPSAES